MKKTLIIILSLFSVVACGGSGGGGSNSSSATSNPTPTNNNATASEPSNKGNATVTGPSASVTSSAPATYAEYTGTSLIPQNYSDVPYSRRLSNVDGGENNIFGNDGNIVWRGDFTYDRNNPSNNHNRFYTGKGVKVGVIDTGFNDTSEANYYAQLRNEVQHLEKVTGTSQPNTEKLYHGYAVTTFLAGRDGIAKGVDVYVSDATSASGKGVTILNQHYKELWDKGVRIFNLSSGSEFTTYSDKSQNFIHQQFNPGVETFFRDAVNNGGLFVFAAGNKETKTSTINATLPYWVPELEKGWINAVGLTAKDINRTAGNNELNYLRPTTNAGAAKNWTVSAVSDTVINLNGTRYVVAGSSYAAPKVTATAALIKEKYPFMTGDLLRQTILSTATDIGDPGVDDVYGWGLLNIDKALEGPALFDKRLALGNYVKINLDGGSYIFSNDISGDAGLDLAGTGRLTLSGNVTYTGKTYVGANAHLALNNARLSSTLSARRHSVVELGNSSISEVNSEGIVVNDNMSSVEKLSLGSEGEIVSDINSNIKTSEANLQGKITVVNSSGEYLTKKGKTSEIITGNVSGNYVVNSGNGLMNVSENSTSENLSINASRRDTVEYAKSVNSDEEQVNTAEQIETALLSVDALYEEGNVSSGLLGSRLQSLNANTLDSMSGQIYASAQVLTFEQSETVNRDLSNRMSDLARSLKNDKKYGFWTSGIYSKGKIEKEGFAKGRTNVKGGQAGFDMKLNDGAVLGLAFDYSRGEVEFNRYNGKSKSEMSGVSLYGRQNLGNFYISGRLGVGIADSKVERDIIVNNNYMEHSKVKHRDKIVAGYLETGYDVKSKKGNFELTPYVALGTDQVTRGKFSEENTDYGMTADKKTYNLPYATAGVKAVKNFGKTDVTGYVSYTHGLNKKNLDFEASYNFAGDAKFKVKGINYSRNKVTAGIGVNTKVTENVNWYANYDYKHSTDNSKGNNSIVTTGIRIEF